MIPTQTFPQYLDVTSTALLSDVVFHYTYSTSYSVSLAFRKLKFESNYLYFLTKFAHQAHFLFIIFLAQASLTQGPAFFLSSVMH